MFKEGVAFQSSCRENTGIEPRTRNFALPDKAKMLGCDRQMIQKEMCSALIPLCDGKQHRYLKA